MERDLAVDIECALDFNTGREPIWTVADLPLIMGVSSNSLAVATNGKRFTGEYGIAMLDPWIAGPNYYSIWSAEQENSPPVDLLMSLPRL